MFEPVTENASSLMVSSVAAGAGLGGSLSDGGRGGQRESQSGSDPVVAWLVHDIAGLRFDGVGQFHKNQIFPPGTPPGGAKAGRQDGADSEAFRDLAVERTATGVRARAALVADIGVRERRLGIEDVVHAETQGDVGEQATALSREGVVHVSIVRRGRCHEVAVAADAAGIDVGGDVVGLAEDVVDFLRGRRAGVDVGAVVGDRPDDAAPPRRPKRTRTHVFAGLVGLVAGLGGTVPLAGYLMNGDVQILDAPALKQRVTIAENGRNEAVQKLKEMTEFRDAAKRDLDDVGARLSIANGKLARAIAYDF